jgi:hypothetical protein
VSGTIFHAAPAFKCHAPARAFWREQEARRWAQEAARAFGVQYALWLVSDGRMRLLSRFAAAPVPA